MRVDVGDVARFKAGIFEGELHAADGADASRRGCGDVVGVSRGGPAEQLGVDPRSARPCPLQLLQDEHGAAFGDDKAVPAHVEGP